MGLQKDLDTEERALVADRDNFGHPGANFKNTAELVAALDLVITVDTAWAHWAGAIGKPVWVMCGAPLRGGVGIASLPELLDYRRRGVAGVILNDPRLAALANAREASAAAIS